MTLIVGIKCVEGVVLASDGALTGTITQQTKKLSIINGCIAIGSSGPIGLSQRFAGVVEGYCQDGSYASKAPYQVMTELAEWMRQHIRLEAGMADFLKNIAPGANQAWCAATIIALPVSGRASLFSFDYLGAPYQITDQVPYASIGSGAYLAEPFLAFIQRIVWQGTQPNLGKGIFSAIWALNHAIKTSPGGVSDPVQVVILRQENGAFQVRELTDAELGEPREAIKAVEKSMAESITQINASSPAPPTPPVTTALPSGTTP